MRARTLPSGRAVERDEVRALLAACDDSPAGRRDLAMAPESLALDRVIGLPGEQIDLQDKRVYIDGRPIEDPWAMHSDSRT